MSLKKLCAAFLPPTQLRYEYAIADMTITCLENLVGFVYLLVHSHTSKQVCGSERQLLIRPSWSQSSLHDRLWEIGNWLVDLCFFFFKHGYAEVHDIVESL